MCLLPIHWGLSMGGPQTTSVSIWLSPAIYCHWIPGATFLSVSCCRDSYLSSLLSSTTPISLSESYLCVVLVMVALSIPTSTFTLFPLQRRSAALAPPPPATLPHLQPAPFCISWPHITSCYLLLPYPHAPTPPSPPVVRRSYDPSPSTGGSACVDPGRRVSPSVGPRTLSPIESPLRTLPSRLHSMTPFRPPRPPSCLIIPPCVFSHLPLESPP